MNGVKNDYTPYLVLTDHGFVDIRNVRLQDKVCGYNNEIFTVMGIEDVKDQLIFDITYTDRRHALYGGFESIFNGRCMLSIDEIKDHRGNFSRTPQHEFDFHRNDIHTLIPDPYIAGALLIYGSYDTSFINLPLKAKDVTYDHIQNKYHLIPNEIPKDGIVTFRYSGDTKNITWEQFFPGYDSFVGTRIKYAPIVPNRYMYASVEERKQFIMGVFDIGYNKWNSPDYIIITHWKEERLKIVQKILWSLGISSTIEYNPNIPGSSNMPYVLTVLDEDFKGYPGFFYDIGSIKNHILNDTRRIIRSMVSFKFAIDHIDYTGKRSFMNRLILNKEQAVFVSNDYLPRVSK